MTQVIGLRALNRATLARQLLLKRSSLSVAATVEHLVGFQAQTPHTWYVGLWSRIEGFQPGDASTLLTGRQLVRIALMRSTIHLVTAADCLALRPLLQPVLERSMSGNFGKNLAGIDRDRLIASARALVDAQPMTFGALGSRLAEKWPGRDRASLAQAARAWLPLVQVPPRGVWGRSGPIAHTSAEAWLGRKLMRKPSLQRMVLRYLGAFGPASVRDVQTWSGLTRLREVLDRLRPQLVTFRDENGRELFDQPHAPRPDPDTPAPARLLYDFDNLLLSHSDRGRVVTDEYRRQQYAPDGPMPQIVLLDGFTRGDWKITRERRIATLTIRPFGPFSKPDRVELEEEGARLLKFAASDAVSYEVVITKPRLGPARS
jgi:hypothetical protein